MLQTLQPESIQTDRQTPWPSHRAMTQRLADRVDELYSEIGEYSAHIDDTRGPHSPEGFQLCDALRHLGAVYEYLQFARAAIDD